MEQAIIINGSPRVGANSDAIAAFAKKHFAEHGIDAVIYNIRDMKIHPCVGCDTCKGEPVCVFSDDATELITRLISAQRSLLVAPLYYTNLPGTVKVLIDRFYVNYDPWKYGGKRAPDPARRFGTVLTYGGSPEETALGAIELASYAWEDLGFGSREYVLCPMNIEKTSFSGNSEFQEETAGLVGWIAGAV
ncbi:MAG: flavodoxin family protein [Oscillospiraceae bacterium]|jgi:multimeric flavodoxin WrbA|nr:flavodoxin family protein [Oscillospiraceae bacterium]